MSGSSHRRAIPAFDLPRPRFPGDGIFPVQAAAASGVSLPLNARLLVRFGSERLFCFGFPERAGVASSLVGAMHYGSGILSAAMVGWFADGTPWTMAWIMGLAGVGSLATALVSQRRQRAAAMAASYSRL